MRWKKQNQNQISENWVKVSFRFLLDFPGNWFTGMDWTWCRYCRVSCLQSVLILEHSEALVYSFSQLLASSGVASSLIKFRKLLCLEHDLQGTENSFTLESSEKLPKLLRNSTVRFCHLSCYMPPRTAFKSACETVVDLFLCPPHPSASAPLSSGKKHFASINFSEERTKIINEWIF